MISHLDGQLLLPRLIRYVKERKHYEARFTGAIERHPSPLVVVWEQDDPIAVPSMTDRLLSARTDIQLHLLRGLATTPWSKRPAASSMPSSWPARRSAEPPAVTWCR